NGPLDGAISGWTSTGSGRSPKTKQAGKRLRPRELRLHRTGSPTRRRRYTIFRTWPELAPEGKTEGRRAQSVSPAGPDAGGQLRLGFFQSGVFGDLCGSPAFLVQSGCGLEESSREPRTPLRSLRVGLLGMWGFLRGIGLVIRRQEFSPAHITITVESAKVGAPCPSCGRVSRSR